MADSIHNQVHARYTSSALAEEGFPFALTGSDFNLTDEDWAWRFLRLNPLYRYDYELQRNQPRILKNSAGKLLSDWRKTQPPQELRSVKQFLAMDARRFCTMDHALGSTYQYQWPMHIPETLEEYRQKNNELLTSDVRIRDIDCGRDYGLAHWFDPSLESLPRLEPGQSWFFPFIEPLWWVPQGNLFPPKPSQFRMADGRVIDLGFVGGIRELENMRIFRPETILLMNGDKVEKLRESNEVPPDRPGFSFPTEMLFLISLDGYVGSQINVIKPLAESFQEIRFPGVKPKIFLPPPKGYEPVIFLPERAGGFASLLKSALDDLSKRSSTPRPNWRAVLINVKYNLAGQLSDVNKILTDEQLCLEKENILVNPLRRRTGNKNKKDFWLKRALCVLELHLNMAMVNCGKTLSPERIARAVYDPSDPLYIELRGSQNVRHGISISQPQNRYSSELTENIKEALALGKKLSECLYEFLIGLPTEGITRKETTSGE
ncbi:MAG: hypothetical protein Q8Q81_12560 [Oxalobacteraceae bacterium]|nr:hypothetical protein [Oxalobacteraceae bacterium]